MKVFLLSRLSIAYRNLPLRQISLESKSRRSRFQDGRITILTTSSSKKLYPRSPQIALSLKPLLSHWASASAKSRARLKGQVALALPSPQLVIQLIVLVLRLSCPVMIAPEAQASKHTKQRFSSSLNENWKRQVFW